MSVDVVELFLCKESLEIALKSDVDASFFIVSSTIFFWFPPFFGPRLLAQTKIMPKLTSKCWFSHRQSQEPRNAILSHLTWNKSTNAIIKTSIENMEWFSSYQENINHWEEINAGDVSYIYLCMSFSRGIMSFRDQLVPRPALFLGKTLAGLESPGVPSWLKEKYVWKRLRLCRWETWWDGCDGDARYRCPMFWEGGEDEKWDRYMQLVWFSLGVAPLDEKKIGETNPGECFKFGLKSNKKIN